MTLLVFALILSFLVLIHEFGHFIVARKNGIRVEEFGLGLPPRIFGKKVGETLYSLNLLPFGGFVKLTGEDYEEGVNTNDPRSFSAKKPWQRIQVLVAGVTMNFLLAILLFYIFLISNGFKSQNIPLFFNYQFKFGQQKVLDTVVSGVQSGSASQKSGIQVGEALIDIDGKKVNGVTDIRKVLADKNGAAVTLNLLDVRDFGNSKSRTLTLTPDKDADGNYVLGVYLMKSVVVEYRSVTEKILSGPMHAINMLDYSNFALKRIIAFSIQTKDIKPVSESVSGPVGIYEMIGGILDYGGPGMFLILLDYIALMSLSLAFVNIMPFPALDGGRVLFIVIEVIRKKKVSPIVESRIHNIGMMLLLLLIGLITFKDIFS